MKIKYENIPMIQKYDWFLISLGFTLGMIGLMYVSLAIYFQYFLRQESAINDTLIIVGINYLVLLGFVFLYMKHK